MADEDGLRRYPLLEPLLAQKGLPLRGTYTIRDVAAMFGVSVRAIQERVRIGQLRARDLPGRARFLSEDLEAFLQSSQRKCGESQRRNDS
jgi:transposase